jgi:Predicted membrane protein (DUF2142)
VRPRSAAGVMHVRAALIAGLALTAVAIAITLSGSPSRVLATNTVTPASPLARAGDAPVCQRGEELPGDTSALRLSLEAFIGPRVSVEVFSGGRLLTSGARGPGWSGLSVTVPVSPLDRPAAKVRICLALDRSGLGTVIAGTHTRPGIAARLGGGSRLPGRVAIEYLGHGHSSWASRALSVARRMGLGRPLAGTWIAAFAAALMAAVVLLVSLSLTRELGVSARSTAQGQATKALQFRRVVSHLPTGAVACALVACLNAVCWAQITPAFQVPDEENHYAYVQELAQTGSLPRQVGGSYSPAERTARSDLDSSALHLNPVQRALATEAQQRRLERDMRLALPMRGSGDAGVADSEPPLYYALEAIPYTLGAGTSILARLELMRLLSALMAGATAFFAYLFVREALPRSRWAWTVGGLAVALFPLLGFISGGVNPDGMLYAICTAIYYCLARAFRRGLTPRMALTIGVLAAVGFLTKLNFVGFAPGMILGLALLFVKVARRSEPGERVFKRPLAYFTLTLSIAASPVLLYAALNLLSNRPALGAASNALQNTQHTPASLLHELSYIWQFFLPRLPGTMSYFPGILTPRQLWFNGLVGLYGWYDTPFPSWVYDVALVAAASIAGLGLRELLRRRETLKRRAAELASYGLTAVGILLLVGAQSYVSDVVDNQEPFWAPRYLLPMLALWGIVAALAARGAGKRWGPAVGTIIVMLLLAHDLFSQLQAVARYYG